VTRRVAGGVLACIPAFGFAAYPVIILLSLNAGVVPIEGTAVVRSLFVAFAIAAAVLLLVSVLPWDFHARATWAGMVLLMSAFYQPVVLVATLAGWRFGPDSPLTAAVFVGGAAALATTLVRPWRRRPGYSVALNIALAVLLGTNIYVAIVSGVAGRPERWQPAVDAQIATVLEHQAPTAPERDIYYLVLDGFGRADILRSYYDLDITAFLDFLTANGFQVPPAARSNYSQTFLSLASTLNLSYLDDLASVTGETTRDRRPLDHMIDQNALMKAAKAAGYRVFAVGSDYAATRAIDIADVCICEQRGLAELEHEALVSTPLAPFALARWTYDAHRTKVLETLDTVEGLALLPGKKFVFAHVLAPHPPFVFDADGHARQPRRPFNLRDGDHFQGTKAEYIQGYRDQTRYLVRRLTTFVEHLLGQPGPTPVIVMHADHGPGSKLQWTSVSGSDLQERMSIFAAYAFPGEPAPQLDAAITPVNAARFLARRYLGVNVEQVHDISYFSTWDQPYRFIPVGAAGTEARK
jgi:hypothetical protein